MEITQVWASLVHVSMVGCQRNAPFLVVDVDPKMVPQSRLEGVPNFRPQSDGMFGVMFGALLS